MSAPWLGLAGKFGTTVTGSKGSEGGSDDSEMLDMAAGTAPYLFLLCVPPQPDMQPRSLPMHVDLQLEERISCPWELSSAWRRVAKAFWVMAETS